MPAVSEAHIIAYIDKCVYPTVLENWGSFMPAKGQFGFKHSSESIQKRADTRKRNSIGNISSDGKYDAIFTDQGKQRLHRYVVEQAIGRKLKPDEHIHHIDGNPKNNDISNLQIVTHEEHMGLHGKMIAWSRNHKHCIQCGSDERKHYGKGLCTSCAQKPENKSTRLKWSAKHDSCIDCGTNTIEHGAFGRCRSCHGKYRRLMGLEKPRASRK